MPGSLPRPRIAAFAVMAVTAALLTAVPMSSAHAADRDRTAVRYVVRTGDTATKLAVRYHAWTAELIRANRLGRRGALRIGQVLTIPVVTSVARQDPRTRYLVTPAPRKQRKPRAQQARRPVLLHTATPPKGWRHADLSREQVRDLVRRTAKRHGVPPRLALAIAWQESGWQQRRVSSAGAIGVMQVMPDTGRWMRWYAGRKLRLRDTHDNIWAGVLTLRTLLAWTKKDANAIAAYYQGLGAVRRRGWFDDTLRYVRAVRAHHRRLSQGLPLR